MPTTPFALINAFHAGPSEMQFLDGDLFGDRVETGALATYLAGVTHVLPSEEGGESVCRQFAHELRDLRDGLLFQHARSGRWPRMQSDAFRLSEKLHGQYRVPFGNASQKTVSLFTTVASATAEARGHVNGSKRIRPGAITINGEPRGEIARIARAIALIQSALQEPFARVFSLQGVKEEAVFSILVGLPNGVEIKIEGMTVKKIRGSRSGDPMGKLVITLSSFSDLRHAMFWSFRNGDSDRLLNALLKKSGWGIGAEPINATPDAFQLLVREFTPKDGTILHCSLTVAPLENSFIIHFPLQKPFPAMEWLRFFLQTHAAAFVFQP